MDCNSMSAGSTPVTVSSAEPAHPSTLPLASSLTFYENITLLSLTGAKMKHNKPFSVSSNGQDIGL